MAEPRSALSIGRSLAIGFGAVLLLSGLGVLVAHQAAETARLSLVEVAEAADSGRRMARVGALVREFYMHQAHLALGMETHEHEGHTRDGRVLLSEALQGLEASPRTPSGAAGALRRGVERVDGLFERFLLAQRAGRGAEAKRLHFETAEVVMGMVHEVEHHEAVLSESRQLAQRRAGAASRRAEITSLSVAGAALLCALIVAVGVTRAVTLPVRRLEAAAAAIAQAPEGARVPTAGPPEVAALGGAINEMLSDLEAQRRARLEAETLAALGRVTAGIAHEINNPLGVILGHARLIEKGAEDPVADAAVIAREARTCQEIVKALLDYARPGLLQRAPVDLMALATALAERFEGCSVEGPESLQVEGDRSRLQQLLANLLSNAAAFGEQVTVQLASVRGGVEVRVLDDGPGVATEDLERIFEPFYTGRPEGTGLGLAIARSIATAHGGTLRARPTPQGAHFVAWLPAPGPRTGDHPREANGSDTAG